MAVADWFSGFDYLPANSLSIGITPLFTTVNAMDPSAAQFRTGTRSLYSASGVTAYAYKSGLTARATYSLGFWYYTTSLASAVNFAALGEGALTTAANCHISLRVTTSGKIQVLRGGGIGSGQQSTTQIGSDSTNSLSINTGYHIVVTVTVSDTVGAVEVMVNGSNAGWHNLTSQDTQNGGAAQISAFGFNGGAGFVYYDDAWMAATNLGDCRVTPINASTGDGTLADFTPSSGSDNGAMVDENPPDGDTTYNSSTTAGNRDSYNFPASGITGSTVHGLKLHNYCKKQDAGTVSIKPVIRISGVNYEGTEQFLPTTYSHVTQQYDVSPATAAAWTVSEIDGSEFGIRHHV